MSVIFFTFVFNPFAFVQPSAWLLSLFCSYPRQESFRFSFFYVLFFFYCLHSYFLLWLCFCFGNPFTTGNPFWGTKLLGFSIGRASGALKGLILTGTLIPGSRCFAFPFWIDFGLNDLFHRSSTYECFLCFFSLLPVIVTSLRSNSKSHTNNCFCAQHHEKARHTISAPLRSWRLKVAHCTKP